MSSNQVGSYYYTARAGEQLHVSSPIKERQTTGANETALQGYVSTANQSAVLSNNLNKAVYYSAMAGFALNKSSAVTKLNSYNQKVELNNRLNQNKY